MAKPSAKDDSRRKLRRRLLRLMWESRLSDRAEQALKRRGEGHFMMSAEGHEGLAGAALALRPEDWLHPHYRDRVMMIGRGMPHERLFLDFYSKRDSGSAGRQMPEHFNGREWRIASASSPVGSNFLQAVGMAVSLRDRGVPEVVLATLGDASTREGEVPEALAQAAVEKAPVVFLIEDNRLGISTPTVGKTFWTQPHGLAVTDDGVQWFYGCRVEVLDGLDPEAVHEATAAALERARNGEGPSCLILKLERLQSHSSSDDQRVYRSPEELEEIVRHDPVERYTERCLATGAVTRDEVEQWRAEIRAEVEKAAVAAKAAPEPEPDAAWGDAFAPLPPTLPAKEQALPAALPKKEGGFTSAQCLALVLEQEMRRNERMYVFGEDVEDPKGDVFGTMRGLSRAFPGRVTNSPLAEATVVGVAAGRALAGDTVVATLQFIDFAGPALNQIFNELSSMYWRSAGEWNCPVVVLAPCGAYLPGLGPWHARTDEALYAHVPGLHVVMPSNPADAAGLLRYSLRCRRPVLYLYPKALLHGAEGTVAAPDPECCVPFGRARIVKRGRDVTVVAWGNCVRLCEQAAREAAQRKIDAEIIDLRTVAPWDRKTVLESVARTGRLLVVHEDNRTCGFGGEIIAEATAEVFDKLKAPPLRIARDDEHLAYHYGLELAILPSVEKVTAALQELCRMEQVVTAAGEARVAAAAAVSGRLPPAKAVEKEAAEEVAEEKADSGVEGVLAVKLSKQSPTDEDAVLARYLVERGEAVEAGAPLAEFEANKGSFEIEAPTAGVVLELPAKEGDTLLIGATFLRLKVEGPLPTEAPAPAPTAAEESAPPPPATLPPEVEEETETVPLSPAQMQIGALAVQSRVTVPHASVDFEVDVTDTEGERRRRKAELAAWTGGPVTVTHLVMWALVHSLLEERHAGFRGRLSPEGNALVVGPHADIGFAAVSDQGDLFTPVIHEADRFSFPALAGRMRELTVAARENTLRTHEMHGATITLTNVGVFGATAGDPFVVPGQTAMLCMGLLRERWDFDTAAPRLRLVLPLRLVFDHRPFNGNDAALLLRSIADRLSAGDPAFRPNQQ